jgi:NADH dehydrogenase
MALTPQLSAKVQKRLEKMGVEVILKANIKSVEKTCINMDTGDGQGLVCRLASTVIWVAGVQGADISAQSKLIGEGRGGKIATNEYLQALNDPNVYIAGDNIFYTPEGEKMPVPAMVENAEHSAHTVAHNLLVDVLGEGKKEAYKPAFHGMMVCVGGRWGTAYGGLPGKFFGMPSFFAMLAKHFINVVYFIQVLGWNKIFSYVKHEFFTIRNKRSFLGGHFSNRSASFMLVPLRLFLGAFWVYEAIVKILEGWLTTPHLKQFIGGASQWWDGIVQRDITNKAIEAASAAGDFTTVFALQSQIAAEAADTVTAATEVATAAITNLSLKWDFFGIGQWLVVTGTNIATKIRIPFMDSMLNGLVANDGLSLVMQVVIVLLEIGVGLALMGGFFTTIMAALSIGLQMMFLTSTGLYMDSWWMLFASFAMMFGAGSVFSIDYYLMPQLKKCWKKTKLARKWYWYND